MSTQVLDTPTLAAPRGDAPVTGWRRAWGDWYLVARATAVCHVLGAATSLLLRMLLDPAQMGIWQAVKLFLSYGNYANLGISKGAIREYTVARGRGETAGAGRDLDLSLSVNTLSSILYGGLLVGAGLWIGLDGGGSSAAAWSVGLVTAGLLAALSRYVTFHVTILRAQQDFVITSRLSILEAGLTLALGTLATYLWGLLGLYAATLGVLLASLAYVVRHRGVTLHWAWDTARIKTLIAIGSPILLAGTVSSLFRSLDKVMILAYMSDCERELGCYSVALMVTTQLFGLGNMLAIVMNPRYGEMYGAAGERRAVARLAARASEFQAALMALPAGLALVAGPPILVRLLPAYQSGLASLAWLVPGALALCATLPASQYLVAVNRQRRALWAVLAATAFGAVANHVALAGGHGLPGVAMATCAAYGVYFVLVVGVSLWIDLDAAGRLRYLGMSCLAAGPTLAAALVLSHAAEPLGPSWRSVAAESTLVTAVWAASAALAWHWGGWNRRTRSA